MEQEYYEMKSGSSADKKIGRFPIKYDLVIFDEFQNYLPQQINIIKSCINTDNNSVVYVGDMNQQTQLGTLKDWSQINGSLPASRQVKLKKVYRNTKQILNYIKQIGYNVEIPDNLRGGSEVVERSFNKIDDEIKYVEANLKLEIATGIIARDSNYLEKYKLVFTGNKNVHILSMDEIQGVEFDSVFLVGVNYNSVLSADKLDNIELRQQKQKIDRDLLCVALIRAMNNLYILGLEKLSQIQQ